MAHGLRALFGAIGTLAIINNCLLLAVILNNRSMLKTPYNMMVFSLAITDLMTGICILVTPVYVFGADLVAVPRGTFGQFYCRVIFSQYLVFTLGIVSVYTVTCMAIERWFAVARPTRYKSTFTRFRVKICVFLVWGISVLLNTPHLFEMKAVTSHENKRQCVWITLTEGKLRQAVAVLEFFGKFFLPLLVSFFTIVNLNTRIKASPALFQTNRGKAGLRLLRMCMLTAFVFGVCWFPNQFYYLLFKFDVTKLGTPLHYFTVVFCMSNSCLNPLIYCISNRTYRRGFAALLCRPCHRSRVTGIEITVSASPRSMADPQPSRFQAPTVISLTNTSKA